MSSQGPDLSETSRILLKKAEEDATAVREFAANREIADSIIGFHAQQAVEKWLKGGHCGERCVRHSAIHDIDRLIEIVEASGVAVPLDRDRLAVLTQYAVPLRYDELLDSESLDREVLVGLVDEVAEWVVVQIRPVSE